MIRILKKSSDYTKNNWKGIYLYKKPFLNNVIKAKLKLPITKELAHE